jgi:tRNA (cytidine/uridine-2'-O-)-methyltransferase
MAVNIVLVEPEIPQNTGNIVRTCVATGSPLHLVRPLGFSTDDKYLKRAGLDYWNEAEISYYDNFSQLREQYKDKIFFFCTTKALHSYTEVSFEEDCFLVFGKESAGLPEELLVDNRETCIRIPMRESIRSLNLSNAVAIVAYEAYRQLDFAGLREAGNLARLSWE